MLLVTEARTQTVDFAAEVTSGFIADFSIRITASILADKSVGITNSFIFADKSICITNANSLDEDILRILGLID